MVSTNLDWVIIFLTQMKVGILGNASLLCFYTFTLITGRSLRPTDQILNQLVLANCLVLFSKGIPQEMAAFGLRYFLVVAGYKLVFYFHRVARGVSLSTTCLLGGFLRGGGSWGKVRVASTYIHYQISSKWMELKIRIPKYNGFCCSSCWILNLLVNMHVAIKVHGPSNTKNISLEKVYEYCSGPTPDKLTSLLLAIWASGSMVLVLHRHKQRVQHIHSNSLSPRGKGLSPRPSHEARATRTILILVSSFVLLYSLSSILTFCVVLSVNPALWLVNTSAPFVLITHDTRVSKLRFAALQRLLFSPWGVINLSSTGH
uniref:Vomeronasal type-1 receptor n=1 Tax=Balaenoptera musculus TaxID=9771 RepID=A0A8C0DSI0_BALMU